MLKPVPQRNLDVANILYEMYDNFKNKVGWCQHEAERYDHATDQMQYCIHGMLHKVSVDNFKRDKNAIQHDTLMREVDHVLYQVAEQHNFTSHIQFNDFPMRTKNEVINFLQSARNQVLLEQVKLEEVV